jgi:integrase/recombinase XerD
MLAEPFMLRLLPDDLAVVLDRYLAVDRPPLLQRGNGQNREAADRLWISEDGKPLTAHSIALRISEHTRRAFGMSVSPHLMRDSTVTTIAIELLRQIRVAAPVLGDRSFWTVEKHYNQAECIDAGRRVAMTFRAVQDELRSRLGPPSPRRRR